jgi:ribosomal protein S18 acetylase RimI-like enzyme
LSGVVGYPVFRLQTAKGTVNADASDVAQLVRTHSASHPRALYYAKVDTARIAAAVALAGAGFFPVDVNVTFEMASGLAVPRALPDTEDTIGVADIGPDQHEAILAIAESCFRYSRFHLDPLLPDAIANRIKREWVASYLRRDRGAALLAATLDGRPAGFLAALASEENGHRIYVIDLVGVESSAQRRGVGRALVQTFLNRYCELADVLRVGTQIANVPSMRLYQQLGFSIVGSQYVFHLHVPRSHT